MNNEEIKYALLFSEIYRLGMISTILHCFYL